MRGAAAIFSALVLAAPLAGITPVAADEAPVAASVAVIVIKASSKCFSSIVNATGYMVPRASAVVMFNAPGFRFADVRVKEGDSIKKGDLVAVAVPIGAASAANADPIRLSVTSLATGVVLSRHVEIGDLSSVTGGPLLTLAVDGQMEALVDVPGIHVLELSAGESASITTDDGTEFAGHVRMVPVEINPKTQVGQARISIDGDRAPRMGRFVRVAIDASRSCGIAVPLAALMHESDGLHLQVVKNGTIETRVVHVGLLSDTDAEVMSGVAEGDAVVADAGTSLRDGDKVRPIFADLQEAR